MVPRVRQRTGGGRAALRPSTAAGLTPVASSSKTLLNVLPLRDERDQRPPLRCSAHAALHCDPLSRGRQPHGRIGEPRIQGDLLAHSLVDFGIAFVRAARLALSFHRAPQSALDANMRLVSRLIRRERWRGDVGASGIAVRRPREGIELDPVVAECQFATSAGHEKGRQPGSPSNVHPMRAAIHRHA